MSAPLQATFVLAIVNYFAVKFRYNDGETVFQQQRTASFSETSNADFEDINASQSFFDTHRITTTTSNDKSFNSKSIRGTIESGYENLSQSYTQNTIDVR